GCCLSSWNSLLSLNTSGLWAAEYALRPQHEDAYQHGQRDRILQLATELISSPGQDDADQQAADQCAQVVAEPAHHHGNETVEHITDRRIRGQGQDGRGSVTGCACNQATDCKGCELQPAHPYTRRLSSFHILSKSTHGQAGQGLFMKEMQGCITGYCKHCRDNVPGRRQHAAERRWGAKW